MVIVMCPECSQEVKVCEKPRIGGSLICNACGKKLEIVWLYPLEVEHAEEDLQSTIHRTNLDHSGF